MDNLLAQMGSRILKRRKQLRMTQEELAEKAGVMPQTISTDYLLMGKISEASLTLLEKKISQLPPEKICHLEDIIDSFIAAVIE